ncbi:MAG: hypothetical protein ACYCS7_16835 [Acidimicrobiales bacterium]
MGRPQSGQPQGQPTGGRFAHKINPEPDIRLSDDAIQPQPSAVTEPSPVLAQLLEAAATLQEVVPDATLVGGSAAAFYAGHRDSYDHDHVLSDLSDHYDMVLEAVESQDGWVTNRVVPNKLILGEVGGIETGVRQLIRKTPLEVAHYRLPSGRVLRVPTPDETLRIKGYLVVARNQTRDYLDVAALAGWSGIDRAAATLGDMDRYYADQHQGGDGVASQLARQLADPQPKDSKTTRHLSQYKRLNRRWQDWGEVRSVCASISQAMIDLEPK